ncbi:MAG: hypothetical protein WDN31_00990 [Hyphomicrobium sp.]
MIDASQLFFSAHNEVWKGDREHIRKTQLGERYIEMVTSTIKASEELKALQAKIAQQELDTASKTERDELFQKLVDSDPALAGLLSDRDPVIYVPATGGSETGGEGGKAEFEGKYSPTFVRLEERFRRSTLDIPINRSRAAWRANGRRERLSAALGQCRQGGIRRIHPRQIQGTRTAEGRQVVALS